MTEKIINNFGNNLRKLRKERSITLQELANDLGFSRQILSQYENGEKLPTLYTAIKISNFFHCSIDSLVYSNTEIDVSKLYKISDYEDTQAFIDTLTKNLETIRENSSKVISNSSKIISANTKIIENNNKLISDTNKIISKIKTEKVEK